MGYYEDLRKKQKQTGEYQTRDGGKVTTTPKPSGSSGNVVSNASANLGAGKAETPKPSGGNIVSAASADLGAGRSTGGSAPVKTNNANKEVVDRINAYTVPSFTKKNPNTGASGYDWQSAVKAATDSAKKQQDNNAIMTRYGKTVNYTPYLDEEEETGTTELVSTNYGLPAGFTMQPKDNLYNRERALWLLDKYGMTEADLGGIPLEALYLGDQKYTLPYLMKYPDNDTVLSDGKLITIGELKQRLTNGAYVPGKGMTGGTTSTAQPAAYGAEMSEAEPYAEEFDDMGDEESAYIDYLQAAVDSILGQKSGIDQEAAGAKQQAYANYMRSKLGMGEQTAGMATGMADSLLVQNDMAFQNNLNDIEQERLDAYADIDSQAAQMEAEGQMQLAQMAEERRKEAEERAWQEREWAYQLEQDRIRNADNETVDEDADETNEPSGNLMTASQAEDQIRQILGNYLTKNDVANMLVIMMKNNQIDESVAREVAKKFGLEMI